MVLQMVIHFVKSSPKGYPSRIIFSARPQEMKITERLKKETEKYYKEKQEPRKTEIDP